METSLGSAATFGSVVTWCVFAFSSLTHSTVCPTLIVIFSGTNLCSAVILTTTASDSWGTAGTVASTYTALKTTSVTQMQIADLSVENISESSGHKGFVAMPTSDSKAGLVNHKREFQLWSHSLRIVCFSSPRHNKFATSVRSAGFRRLVFASDDPRLPRNRFLRHCSD